MIKLLRHMTGMLLALGLLAGSAGAETVEVTFLLTNDIDTMGGDDERGGFHRLAGVVNAERAKGGNVIYAHAGDSISPSLFSGFDQGAHIVALLNMTPPDVFAPGNHEFDFGEEVFRQRMSEINFPILAANLRDAGGNPLAGIEDTKMFEFGSAKIGVVGLTAEDAPVKSSPGSLKIAPTVVTGEENAQELRDAGADIVVAVVHAGRAVDRSLFDSRAFDIILSGDDHDLLVLYDGRTVMAESGEQADHVTAIDVSIDIEEADGRRDVSWQPNFRIIDTAGVEPDPDVAARIAAYEEELSKELDVVIGTTETPLDSRRASVRSQETAIGNLITDAMREAVDADVAITNGGGIRGNTEYPAGSEVTRRLVLSELPFGNKTVKLELTGADIRAALENAYSQVEEGGGRFAHVSGMTVEVDLSAPAGSRVKSATVGGEPLDDSKTYTLATNDFMARGGDGYTMFTDAKRILGEFDAKLMANDVMSYVREKAAIAPAVEGRIKL